MKHRSKRLLGILLSLVMALGMLPGMSLTAYATTYESLTVGTVLHVGDAINSSTMYSLGGGSYLNPNSMPYTLVRADIVPPEMPWDDPSISESEAGAYYLFKRSNGTYFVTFDPSDGIYGIGTTVFNATATSDGISVESIANTNPNWTDVTFAVHEAPAHTHSFTYTLNDAGDTITATCSADGCDLTNKQATLTIAAEGGTYDGTTAYSATVTNNIPAVTGDTVGSIAYYKVDTQGATTGGTAQTGAPTNAGYYYASVTLTSGSNTYTAVKAFTVAKADPTAPTDLTATYGQKLSDVVLPTGWTWADSTQSVGNVVSPAATFKANFAGNDNYNAASNVDVTVTVSRIDYDGTKTASVNLPGVKDSTAEVTLPALPDGASYGTVSNGYDRLFSVGEVKDGKVTVTALKDFDKNDDADDKYFRIAVTGATNYNNYNVTVTVTPTFKQIQTITAADVTATYGDTDKKVTATTNGNGSISYAVKDGSADYIDVDASTGALTIKKVGTATVIVTAAETSTYAQATKEVTVTINKANAVAATVTANNRTYDGTEQPLVTVTGTPTGGEMQYALGTATEATEQYTTSIPAKTDAGTYYVWYKVVGDDNHNDSEAACVTVTVAKAAPPDSLTEAQQPSAAEGLVADGTQQALVIAPEELPEGYDEVQYSSDAGENWVSIPTGTEAADYEVLVKYVGDSNHEDFFGETLRVNIRQLTVSFEENGGTEVEDQSLDRGQTAQRPEDPERVGFRFIDWFADEDCTELFDFGEPVLEDTIIYALWEPIMAPESLSFAQEYVLIKPDQTLSLTVVGVAREWLGGIAWSVDDEDVATVDNKGEITGLREGTTWVKATFDDESSALTALCRIDVTDDYVEVTDVRLLDTKATTELYSTEYTRIQVLPELEQIQTAEADSLDGSLPANAGLTAIENARFADEATAAAFELRKVDDRTLEIVPKEEFVHGDAAKLKTLKTSYKSAVTVMIGGQEFTTPETVTLSVKKTQPRLTAKINKFNSFIPGDTQLIAFTGGVPETVTVQDAPDWLTVNTDELTASYTGTLDANKNGKLLLNVKPAGWDLTLPVSIMVSAGKTAPRLSVAPATVNLKLDVDELVYSEAALTVVDPDFWPLGVVSVTEGKNNADGALDVIFEGTSISVRPAEVPTDGKTHTYKVTLALLRNGEPTGVTTALTVKLLANTDQVSVTAKSAGAVDTAIPKSPATITLTPKNANPNSVEITEVTVAAAKGKAAPEDVTERFDVAIDGLTVTLTQAEGAELDRSLSYTATIKTNVGAEATAKVTVKTAATVNANVTIRVAGNIDVIRPDSCVTVTPTVKNCFTYEPGEDDLHVWQLAKVGGRNDYVPADDKFDVTLLGDTYIVMLKPDSGVNHATDKFAVSLRADLDGKPVETAKTNISVRMGTAKLAASTKTVTLLRDDRYSRGTVTLSVADADVNEIDWAKTLEAVVLPVGKDKQPLFQVSRSGNDLVIEYANNALKDFKTATVKVPVFLKGNNSTNPNTTVSISVKLG